MSTTVIPFHGLYRPLARAPGPTPSARSAILRRLGLQLARDEQTRRPPPITLGRLKAGELVESRISGSISAPAPASPEPVITIAAVVEATARRVGVPASALIGYRCHGGSRPIALQVAIYLARTIAGATGKAVERELQTSSASTGYAVSQLDTSATVDPDLDRHIRAIEAELGVR